MDDRSFDHLARALGGASTRRGALAALGALLAGGGALDTAAQRNRRNDGPAATGKRRNRKRCNPECTGNFSCVKGACACESVMCGTACCDDGQICQRGRCVGQGTVFCHDLGEACGDGARCCDGLQCGSGYGGGPVACWPRPGGECIANEECAYGQHCEDGACVYDPPPPPPPPPAPACTVCASGCPHSTIEAAIAAASAGDVITIAAGTYTPPFRPAGYLQIDKALTLKACQPSGTVSIACPGREQNFTPCIHAKAAATLEGLNLDTSKNGNFRVWGVYSTTSSTVTIDRCRMKDVSYGVYSHYSIGGPISINGLEIGSAEYYGLITYIADISCSAAVTYGTNPVSPARTCSSNDSNLNPINDFSRYPGCGCQP